MSSGGMTGVSDRSDAFCNSTVNTSRKSSAGTGYGCSIDVVVLHSMLDNISVLYASRSGNELGIQW